MPCVRLPRCDSPTNPVVISPLRGSVVEHTYFITGVYTPAYNIPSFQDLKLKIDKRLHLRCYELIHHKYHQYCNQNHHPHRQHGKIQAIPPFPPLRQPMDYHPCHKQYEHKSMRIQYLRYLLKMPLATYHRHHLLRGAPRMHTLLCRTQI